MSVETGSSAEDERRLAQYAAVLADGIDAAIAPWVERCVATIATAYFGAVSPELASSATQAGRRAREDLSPQVRALLARDVDEQRTTPLAILRSAVPYPTRVLHEAGVPPVVRDGFAVEQFPDDDYDLTPAGFADLDPALHEPGLVWGAAKAHVHIQRHR